VAAFGLKITKYIIVNKDNTMNILKVDLSFISKQIKSSNS